MIIDCHTHISCPGCDISVDDHLAASEALDGCLVLAGSNNSKDENKALSDYVTRYPKKFFGFAVINPLIDDISAKALTNLKDRMKIDGIVLYCCGHGYNPTHSKAMQFYEVATDINLPIFFHNTPSFGNGSLLNFANPIWIDEIAQKFSDLKMIIGSMGSPFLSEALSVIARNENVYGDLTINPEKVWGVYNTVIASREAEVMDKLLFGSGLPMGSPQNCIETLLGFNKLLGGTNLPIVQREKIRGIIERDTLTLLSIDH